MKRLILVLVILLLLAGAAVVVWSVLDLPPVRLVLAHGFPPGCEATGRVESFGGVEFVEISVGYYRMGSHFYCEEGDLRGRVSALMGLEWGKQPKHESDECPPHWVELPRRWWVARYEVTNAQYERLRCGSPLPLTGFRPEHERSEYSPGDRHPVVNVAWEDAQAYCRWLAEETGKPMRLPSESEWECACRAGSETEYVFGDDAGELGAYGWYDENSQGSAHEVGRREPNAWGLHDLHGNVLEWCEDTYHENFRGAPGDGSAWTEGGEEWEPGVPDCVYRGGCWGFPADWCRSAYRGWDRPGYRGSILGFRPSFSPSED